MYYSPMKELKQLAKRLRTVPNLSEFARNHKLLYRTLTRIRSTEESDYVPTYKTVVDITKALDKEGK